jgi:hypothetical protein
MPVSKWRRTQHSGKFAGVICHPMCAFFASRNLLYDKTRTIQKVLDLHTETLMGPSRPQHSWLAAISILISGFCCVFIRGFEYAGFSWSQYVLWIFSINIKVIQKDKPNKIRRCL